MISLSFNLSENHICFYPTFIQLQILPWWIPSSQVPASSCISFCTCLCKHCHGTVGLQHASIVQRRPSPGCKCQVHLGRIQPSLNSIYSGCEGQVSNISICLQILHRVACYPMLLLLAVKIMIYAVLPQQRNTPLPLWLRFWDNNCKRRISCGILRSIIFRNYQMMVFCNKTTLIDVSEWAGLKNVRPRFSRMWFFILGPLHISLGHLWECYQQT